MPDQTLLVGGSTAAPIAVHGAAAPTVTVRDPEGLTAADPFTVTVRRDRTPFDASWTVAERGGSAGGRGTVDFMSGTAVLREGSSFTTTLSRSFVVPDGMGSLMFAAPSFGFDTPDPAAFVNDAFEAALLDAAGNPLVTTIGSGRDAFFNVTETQSATASPGVTTDGGRITPDLSGVPAGTVATLVFRLVSNDADRTGNVGIEWFALPSDEIADAPVKFFVAEEQTTHGTPNGR